VELQRSNCNCTICNHELPVAISHISRHFHTFFQIAVPNLPTLARCSNSVSTGNGKVLQLCFDRATLQRAFTLGVVPSKVQPHHVIDFPSPARYCSSSNHPFEEIALALDPRAQGPLGPIQIRVSGPASSACTFRKFRASETSSRSPAVVSTRELELRSMSGFAVRLIRTRCCRTSCKSATFESCGRSRVFSKKLCRLKRSAFCLHRVRVEDRQKHGKEPNEPHHA